MSNFSLPPGTDRNSVPDGDLGPSNELNRPRQARTVFFHRDGDSSNQSLRVPIHPNRYRGLDALLTDLTLRMPQLAYGVRAVFTPRGRHRVASLEDLAAGGHYVCSTNLRRPGVPLESGGDGDTERTASPKPPPKPPPLALKPRRQLRAPAGTADAGAPPDCKRVYISRNDDRQQRHILLLNRRTLRSFEQLLDDLSGIFRMLVCRLYTSDGRPVESLSALYNGPDSFVAAGSEKFQTVRTAWSGGGGGTGRNGADKAASPAPAAIKTKPQKIVKSLGHWRVQIDTPGVGHESSTAASSSRRLFLTVYGRQGCSGPLPLLRSQALIDEAESDFEVHTGQIGEILKVRLSLEARPRSSAAATVAAASAADLPVGRLVMTDADTGEELRFDFNCSLARAMMCKELPALGRDGRPVLPVERYTLEVHTGDLYNAGTSAAVTVTLHGDLGDTGPRELLFDRVEDKDFQVAPFMKGQVDKFSLEAVHLGRLTKLSVCHDAREPGHGWYLDKVAVRPESQPDEAAEFLCYRWLDSAEDDGRLARDLRPLRRQSAAAAASAGVPPDEQPALQQLERSSWQGIAWMFENNCTVQLYCPATGRPVRVNSDTSGKSGAQCEFRLRPHELLPRSVVVASARRPSQQLLLNADGRQSTLSTSKKAAAATSLPQPLVPHCRGRFRQGSVVTMATSREQALAVEQDGRRLNGAGAFVTLRSCSSGLWLGFEPDGRAVPVSDDAEPNVRLYPEVLT
uniref:Oxygen-regulated protein 1 n=1 Tax=Macrostomum lignano TaxID=282301 RepID=A0A1I8JCT0_9PLAT